MSFINERSNSTKGVFLPELLAPAGSVEGMKAVTAAGADAVYIGGARFGARAYAENPEEEELLDAIDYAHLRGVKVYLTVNTLLKERELRELVRFVEPYYRRGIDAVLVQDFGVLRCLRSAFPDLPFHASTQMTVTGPESAALLSGCGVTRIVPAREMNFRELDRIRNMSGLEIEVFIHGALCYCYSGQCLYSSLLGGRSGNRGRCAQPCRLLYLLDDDTYDGQHSILEEPEARHFLSPKDLCAADLIPAFISHHIDSLKIEGRMKKPEYAAGVTSVYRACLDRCAASPDTFSVKPSERQMLYDLYNRSGFTDGYFSRRNGPEMMALVKHELTREETDARHRLYEEMRRKYVEREDPIWINGTVTVMQERPIAFSVTAECRGRQIGDTSATHEECQEPSRPSSYATETVSEMVSETVYALSIGEAAQTAANRPLDEDRIRKSAEKTGGTDFTFRNLAVDTDGKSFVPMSKLNDLRRDALSRLREAMLAPYRRNSGNLCFRTTAAASPVVDAKSATLQPDRTMPASAGDHYSPELSVLASTEEQFRAALSVSGVRHIDVDAAILYRAGSPLEGTLRYLGKCRGKGISMGIAFPRVDREGSDVPEIKEHAAELFEAGVDSFLVRSFETAAYFIRRGLAEKIRADANVYTWNSEALSFLRHYGIRSFTAPFELNAKELRQRMKRGAVEQRNNPENSTSRENTGGKDEIVVYGRIPLMVTAQCLKKNTDRCTKSDARMTITDRMGVTFPVLCCCVFCYNTIYNSLPLDLTQDLEEIKQMGFGRFRVDLSTESARETTALLKKFASGGTVSDPGTTRGHFRRGAE